MKFSTGKVVSQEPLFVRQTSQRMTIQKEEEKKPRKKYFLVGKLQMELEQVLRRFFVIV